MRHAYKEDRRRRRFDERDYLLGSLKPSGPAAALRLFRFFAIYVYRTRIDYISPMTTMTYGGGGHNQTRTRGQLNEYIT